MMWAAVGLAGCFTSQRGLCWGKRLAGEAGAVYPYWDISLPAVGLAGCFMSQRGLCWGKRLPGEAGAVYLDWDAFFFYFLLQPMLILISFFWCHKFQLHLMSLMPQVKGTFIKIEHLKWSHAHLKRRWQEFVVAISHNTSFTHCPVLNLILAWFRWKLVGNWTFSTNLWLRTLLSLS